MAQKLERLLGLVVGGATDTSALELACAKESVVGCVRCFAVVWGQGCLIQSQAGCSLTSNASPPILNARHMTRLVVSPQFSWSLQNRPWLVLKAHVVDASLLESTHGRCR